MDASYRAVIDRLVESCTAGQGLVAATRARSGVWNPNADAGTTIVGDQGDCNGPLARLSDDDREILAQMLQDTFISAVHESLVVLDAQGVPPWDEGSERSPYADFMGRLLIDWEWPTG
jgi:hypothetical protein